MLHYAAASHAWRTLPLSWADWAWRRRGRSLLARAGRSVPAYASLLQILADPSSPDQPPLPTSRRSYVDVFPLDQRCHRGWPGHAVAFDAAAPADPAWPRAREELRTLGQQLVSLLSGWFDATHRRTLLVLALPQLGWASRARISQALQAAIAAGHLQAAVVDPAETPSVAPPTALSAHAAGVALTAPRAPFEALSATVSRLAAGFEQCILLADSGSGAPCAATLAGLKVRTGLVVFGPWLSGIPAAIAADIPICSVLGADEVGPLIAVETQLSRLLLGACRTSPSLQARLLPDGVSPVAMYQPTPRGPWLEQVGSDLFVSSWGASPLLRYRLGRRGRVLSFGHVCNALAQERVLPPRQLKRLTRIESPCWKLPLIVLG